MAGMLLSPVSHVAVSWELWVLWIEEATRTYLAEKGFALSKLMGFGSDGGAVMIGRLSGVATKLHQNNPYLLLFIVLPTSCFGLLSGRWENSICTEVQESIAHTLFRPVQCGQQGWRLFSRCSMIPPWNFITWSCCSNTAKNPVCCPNCFGERRS